MVKYNSNLKQNKWLNLKLIEYDLDGLEIGRLQTIHKRRHLHTVVRLCVSQMDTQQIPIFILIIKLNIIQMDTDD